MTRVRRLALGVVLFLIRGLAGCGGGDEQAAFSCPDDAPDLDRPVSWTVASHCPGGEPDYDEVFGAGVVHRLQIEIAPEDHDAALADLDDKYSGGGATGDLDALPDPIWIPATVLWGGRTWTGVGMRWKGHSSLKAAWQSGVRKLSFKLSFDRAEDVMPELADQRFFGFRKLSFSNAFNDPSLVRERVATDVFRAGGVPAARTAFAAVTMDSGDGPVYLGLYTIVEDPSDTMLDVQFGDDEGNLYKPWGEAARWLAPEQIDVAAVAETFERANNEDAADWSDVFGAIQALHADRSDPARWRSDLEDVFDVQAFLRALAINQVMLNWDSYGCMHHNYYVYASPAGGGRFVWFPWDLNEAMLVRRQSGCPAPGSVMLDEIVSPDPDDDEIDADWPLIALLLEDPLYREQYRTELRAALDGAFAADDVIARMREAHELVAPFVVGPEAVEEYPYTNTTPEGFRDSLTTGEHALEPHVALRHEAVEAALAQ